MGRRAMAAKLADWLGETEEEPRGLVFHVVTECGEAFTYAVCMEALRVEASGGMLRKDGLGRRTPGGVFFTLVRAKVGRWRFYKLITEPRKTGRVRRVPGPRPERLLRGPGCPVPRADV